MKKFVLLIAFLTSTLISHSQDIIIKKDGSEMPVRVVEVGIDEIRYRKIENLEGPVYVISKAEVFMIKFENGEKEVFGSETPATGSTVSSQSSVVSADRKIPKDMVTKSRTWGIVGFAMAAPVQGLAIAAAYAEDFESGTIIGGVTTLGFGITAPIIAKKARNVRDITGVEGAPSARITAWILYGLSVADAVTAVALSAAEIEVPDPTVILLGTMAGVSSILFGLDAIRTADQAKQYIASPKIVPMLEINRDRLGNQFTSIGVQFNF